MAELTKYMLDVGTIYHNLLFSYQRSLKQHFGTRSAIYVHPTLEHLLKMEEQGGLKLADNKTFEEAVAVFTDFLVKGKIVSSCKLENDGEDKYIFRVEGCIWSGKVHTQVNLKDVTCPYAMVVMAFYKKYKGFVANECESEYFHDGTETILEPATY
ncbi:MAG: hypothetical protein ACQCN3_12990 [Candidatus Bathyarchaeia archaeon]|jgi:hypothetical protein